MAYYVRVVVKSTEAYALGISFFCFFEQKTAYEMRISDWSSDVCSSDLKKMFSNTEDLLPVISFNAKASKEDQKKHNDFVVRMVERGYTEKQAIGRATCRERVCQDV